ncbi:hypothetical protein J6590_087587, partial [Homalodisca vitripennis]
SFDYCSIYFVVLEKTSTRRIRDIKQTRTDIESDCNEGVLKNLVSPIHLHNSLSSFPRSLTTNPLQSRGCN